MSRKPSRLPANMLDPFSSTAPAAPKLVPPEPEAADEGVTRLAEQPERPRADVQPEAATNPAAVREGRPAQDAPVPRQPEPAATPEVKSVPSGTPGIALPMSFPTASRLPPVGRRLTPSSALAPRGYTAGGRPPAADLGQTAPVRLTAYLRPDQVESLRHEAFARQSAGQRSDVSSLIREAVDSYLRR